MPTPFMCHGCDKPTMNKSGVCNDCAEKKESSMKVDRKMLEYWIGQENPKDILIEIANSIFDDKEWSPSILNKDIVESWKEKEKE